jgi:hypothetical protein
MGEDFHGRSIQAPKRGTSLAAEARSDCSIAYGSRSAIAVRPARGKQLQGRRPFLCAPRLGAGPYLLYEREPELARRIHVGRVPDERP